MTASFHSAVQIDVVVHYRRDRNSTLARIHWQGGRINVDIEDSSFGESLFSRLRSLEMGRNQFEDVVRSRFHDDQFSFTLSYQAPRSGWIILRTYEWVLEQFPVVDLPAAHYAVPTLGAPVPAIPYRGIDRPPLSSLNSTAPWANWAGNHLEGEPQAVKEMTRLEDQGRSADDLIATKDDAQSVMSRLVDSESWDLVWVSDIGRLPADCALSVSGFEPSYLIGDHFSPLCDSMFFPRWHGSDESGQQLSTCFEALNSRGLFSTSDDASEFLASCLQQDWAEKDGEYVIIAVGS